MTRWLLLLAATGLTVSCLPAAPTGAPSPEPGTSPPLVARPVGGARPPVAPVADPDSVLLAVDSAVVERLAADSARDAAVLERLHDVEPPAALGDEEFDLASAFDINVARYAEHPRVRYYLGFFQGSIRERMAIWLGRLPRYEPMIRAALAEHNLPGDLVYLGLIESGYSNTAVSRARAVGMWQFMRATGREYGLRIDGWVDERRDPIRATRAAARYLADLTAMLGSHYLAAAAYNGGPGRVMRGLQRLGDGPAPDDDEATDSHVDDQFFRLSDTRHLKQETKDYVPKLIAAAMIAKQPEKYGFEPIPDVAPFAVDSVPVTEPTSLEAVARASGVPLEEILQLNPHYLRRVTPPGPLAWVRVPPGLGVAATEALANLPREERLAAREHVVRPGETVASIARRYGVGATALSEFNGGVTTRDLKAGATLRIPGPRAVAAIAAAGAAPTGEGQRSTTGIHVVRRGETLGGIAQTYRVTVAQLKAWNGLGSSNLIRAGQRLRVRGAAVPSGRVAAGGITHLVRPGETLSALARRYGVTVAAIMEANGLRSASDLKAGARLLIPS